MGRYVVDMAAVPGFDERLNSALEKQAATAGESVDTYIQHAVILRLVADTALHNSSELELLLGHLTALGLDGPLLPAAAAAAVVRDPSRLQAVAATGLLDSPPEDSYDRITAMAVSALGVPAAAVSLVDRDRQFFKSARGLSAEAAAARETSMDDSVCKFAIASGEPLIVEDTRIDALLKDHPVVVGGGVIAYAGIPIIDNEGHSIGTLCVWDDKPRQWSTGHVLILTDLAGMVRDLIYGMDAKQP
jgi:GAF domain-containing protein